MKFLQRLMGGDGPPDSNAGDGVAATSGPGSSAAHSASPDPMDLAGDDDEQARELALLKEEHRRLDDLAQRQQRYAQYSWQPPKQGGERRADDQAES